MHLYCSTTISTISVCANKNIFVYLILFGFCAGLKRVTADMQTHKNTAIRTGPAPFKAPAQSIVAVKASAPVAPTQKEPIFTQDGKKWLIVSQV